MRKYQTWPIGSKIVGENHDWCGKLKRPEWYWAGQVDGQWKCCNNNQEDVKCINKGWMNLRKCAKFDQQRLADLRRWI